MQTIYDAQKDSTSEVYSCSSNVPTPCVVTPAAKGTEPTSPGVSAPVTANASATTPVERQQKGESVVSFDGDGASLKECSAEDRKESDKPARMSSKEYFKNSRERGADEIEEMLNSPGMFKNPSLPQYIREQEQPHHRIFVFLKAQGLSNKEIAERTGYTVCTVGEVLKQPWARLQLVEELRIAGRDALQGLLSGECVNSVYTLIEVRDNEEEKGATRVQAANSILNRCLGNPTQPLELSSHGDLGKLSDEELLAELEQIRNTTKN